MATATPKQASATKSALEWLDGNYDRVIGDLGELVAIPSISTDGQHADEIRRSAALIEQQMQQAGLENVEILQQGNSNPYVYGEWLRAPGKPTVFLYSHHDVQPVNFADQWESDPWTLTQRGGRLYGRGAADDKGAITAQLASVEAYLKTHGSLPVNVKVLVEGEEEIGSATIHGFLRDYRERLDSDVIVVTDTENIKTGLPSITYSLRGVVAALVEVEALKHAVHSGLGGGLLPDAALALNAILSRLCWNSKKVPIPGFYDRVRALTSRERATLKGLPLDERKLRPKASAIVSMRTVPDQRSEEVFARLRDFLTKDPPWGVKVRVTPHSRPVSWWMTDPTGPAFEAALAAMHSGYRKAPVAIGCGGSIGFVGPLAELFGGAPALLLGIEDPQSNAHAPNESLHEGDFRKLIASLIHLYENLGRVSPDELR
jgi:acetylornithine deacetylase/succinyl-diaminopimelate desuccinylase-like protein